MDQKGKMNIYVILFYYSDRIKNISHIGKYLGLLALSRKEGTGPQWYALKYSQLEASRRR